ncbi:MAG TPA: S9 family peptidase [Gemmatimonadaceae bacterium]|nr:S9 family peptidase [Gemmatimonadaceae bacterium]
MRARNPGSIFTLMVLCGLALPDIVAAQVRTTVPLIPLEHFFDNPEIAGAQISPDGRWLSYLKPYKGKLNVYIRPVNGTDANERVMTTDTLRPVGQYFWSRDARYILYAQDKGGNENFRIYAVDPSQAGVPVARDLTPFDKVRASIFAVPRRTPGRILIGLNRRTPAAFDAYWLDLASGKLDLAIENPGRHGAYLIDKAGQIRVATQSTPSGANEILVRAKDGDPWKTLATYPATEDVTPLRITPDGKRLYVRSNAGTANLSRLLLLDLATGKETVIESDPKGEVDFGSAVFSDVTDSLIATTYTADTVRVYPRTKKITKLLADVRKLHDGAPGISSSTADESKYIVSFNSPTDPGATYLYDAKTGQSKFLHRPRPWLKPAELSNVTPVSFTARDGLKIHGYLTTPRGVEAKNLPMILLVHGGPWARDNFGYQPEAQLLANRGYGVLQVNYRGSTGYGKSFFNAAVKEFSGKMHTDLLDGVNWAVQKGIANSKKVGIYGGSYGGYATLVGVTFSPDVFACGVDYVGPSSLVTLVESFPPYWRPFMEGSWFRFVGDPAKPADRADMLARSPLTRVDSIRVPLLVVQGANDPRVTKLEADQLVAALRDRGVKVKYIVAPNEGHGFANPNNRLALYRAMEEFFGECLGGRVQPTVAESITSHLKGLIIDPDSVKLGSKKP